MNVERYRHLGKVRLPPPLRDYDVAYIRGLQPERISGNSIRVGATPSVQIQILDPLLQFVPLRLGDSRSTHLNLTTPT